LVKRIYAEANKGANNDRRKILAARIDLIEKVEAHALHTRGFANLLKVLALQLSARARARVCV
jgi:hypothetical protein